MSKRATLRALMKSEAKAYRALMSDPAVLADKTAQHTPALKAAWDASADAERAYREAMGI